MSVDLKNSAYPKILLSGGSPGLDDNTLLDLVLLNVRPQVSLTAPNCDHFAQVSLTVLDIFLDAI